VLLHDVVVVEQPVPGRAEVGALVGGSGEARVGALQDAAGAFEAGEQGRAPPAAGSRRRETLAGGRDLGALGEVLGAEELAVDRAGEEVLAGIGAAAEETREGAAQG
jgi:hypothetical protein